MPDMLVNLLNLESTSAVVERFKEKGFTLRRAQPFELTTVTSFVESNFSRAWADEAQVGFANKPVSVFIATREGKILGFAAYECTRRDYFGPTGVIEAERGKGLGTALLLLSLEGLRGLGYTYAIIGGAGPMNFYKRAVNAIEIPGSEPGIYTDLLK
jgi:predicted N-acetyltransferase YhbS